IGVSALIIYLMVTNRISIKWPDKSAFHFNKIKEILNYGFYVILTSAGGRSVRNLDILMLGALAGLTETGIYSIGFFIGIVIDMPKRALEQISIPIVAKALNNKNKSKVDELYKKTSINNLIIGGFIFILIWSNLDNIFEIMPKGDIYSRSKYVILFIAAARLINMLGSLNGQIIMHSEHYRYNLYIAISLLILTIITNLTFIPIYGLTGAAIATFISILTINFLRFLLLYNKEGLQPFSIKTLFSLLLVIGLTFFIPLVPNIENPFIDIFIKLIIITTLYAPIVYMLKLSDDINNLILQSMKRIGIKL
ncbi:MAG: lipopolysaccharide biosynthesis protein, partial [Flavobacteriales bacterium]